MSKRAFLLEIYKKLDILDKNLIDLEKLTEAASEMFDKPLDCTKNSKELAGSDLNVMNFEDEYSDSSDTPLSTIGSRLRLKRFIEKSSMSSTISGASTSSSLKRRNNYNSKKDIKHGKMLSSSISPSNILPFSVRLTVAQTQRLTEKEKQEKETSKRGRKKKSVKQAAPTKADPKSKNSKTSKANDKSALMRTNSKISKKPEGKNLSQESQKMSAKGFEDLQKVNSLENVEAMLEKLHGSDSLTDGQGNKLKERDGAKDTLNLFKDLARDSKPLEKNDFIVKKLKVSNAEKIQKEKLDEISKKERVGNISGKDISSDNGKEVLLLRKTNDIQIQNVTLFNFKSNDQVENFSDTSTEEDFSQILKDFVNLSPLDADKASPENSQNKEKHAIDQNLLKQNEKANALSLILGTKDNPSSPTHTNDDCNSNTNANIDNDSQENDDDDDDDEISGYSQPFPYILHEIEFGDGQSSSEKMEDPRLSKNLKQLKSSMNASSSSLVRRSTVSRETRFSDNLFSQQMEKKINKEDVETPKISRSDKAIINERIYKMLHQSPWYHCLLPSVKIQVNQTMREFISALVSFFIAKESDPSLKFEIYTLDNAGEILEILHSIGVDIDANGQFQHYNVTENIPASCAFLDQITPNPLAGNYLNPSLISPTNIAPTLEDNSSNFRPLTNPVNDSTHSLFGNKNKDTPQRQEIFHQKYGDRPTTTAFPNQHPYETNKYGRYCRNFYSDKDKAQDPADFLPSSSKHGNCYNTFNWRYDNNRSNYPKRRKSLNYDLGFFDSNSSSHSSKTNINSQKNWSYSAVASSPLIMDVEENHETPTRSSPPVPAPNTQEQQKIINPFGENEESCN